MHACIAVHVPSCTYRSGSQINRSDSTINGYTQAPSSSCTDLPKDYQAVRNHTNRSPPPPPTRRVHLPGRSVPSTAVVLFCPSAGFLSSVLAWRASRWPTCRSSINLRRALVGPIDVSRGCQLFQLIQLLCLLEGLLYAGYMYHLLSI